MNEVNGTKHWETWNLHWICMATRRVQGKSKWDRRDIQSTFGVQSQETIWSFELHFRCVLGTVVLTDWVHLNDGSTRSGWLWNTSETVLAPSTRQTICNFETTIALCPCAIVRFLLLLFVLFCLVFPQFLIFRIIIIGTVRAKEMARRRALGTQISGARTRELWLALCVSRAPIRQPWFDGNLMASRLLLVIRWLYWFWYCPFPTTKNCVLTLPTGIVVCSILICRQHRCLEHKKSGAALDWRGRLVPVWLDWPTCCHLLLPLQSTSSMDTRERGASVSMHSVHDQDLFPIIILGFDSRFSAN